MNFQTVFEILTSKLVLKKFWERFTYVLVAREYVETIEREKEALSRLYRVRTSALQAIPNAIAGIVFSMDRALQLHALLCSYFEHVSNPAPLYVLYRTSGKLHRRAYEELPELFARRNVVFIAQDSRESFQAQTLQILESLRSVRIFFLVDDIVFINPFDMDDFASCDTRLEVASLRLGEHITKCYVLQKEQPLPPWISDVRNDRDKLCWLWGEGQLDWGYPLSLDGHLFAADEFYDMIQTFAFASPNQLEAGLQVFKTIFVYRYGISYRTSKIVNIPCNRVQKDFDNLCGSLHQDDLLRRWNDGMQMDYRRLAGLRAESVHQQIPLIFVPRSSSLPPNLEPING